MPGSEREAAAPGPAGVGDAPQKSSSSDLAAPAPSADVSGSAAPDDEEDMLLVSEFPPPPHYYHLASRGTPSHLKLTPPEIPTRAFRVAAKRVARERAKAREESERMRLEAEGGSADGTHRGNGGGDKDSTGKSDGTAAGNEEDDDSIDPDDPNEPVVAVFGEIVEDPTLVVEEECNDPVEIRENVKKLNRAVLTGFLGLVQKLVNDPSDNKKIRDELSHNLFLMLQECNKFREHQAREMLIETLEMQLEKKREGLDLLQRQIGEADEALDALKQFR